MTTPFGEAIRRIRRERGVSQKDMARALNVSAAYLSALENGKRGQPGFDFLQRVAAISHPRVVVDTAGMPASYTALANRLARQIRVIRPETVLELTTILDRAAQEGEKTR